MKKIIALLIILNLSNNQINPFDEETFTMIYKTNGFGGTVSVSGPGSDLLQTNILRKELSNIIRKFNIQTVLDAPCGDFYWMQHVDLCDCSYIGIDIVKPLIELNKKKFENNKRKFYQKNVIFDTLPKVDLIICRDLLVHLSFELIEKVLVNFKKSGSKYLLTTTYTNDNRVNNDIVQKNDWRPLNLAKAPFYLHNAIYVINEGCTEYDGAANDKCMALYELDKIPKFRKYTISK